MGRPPGEMVERVAEALLAAIRHDPYGMVPDTGPNRGPFGLDLTAFALVAIRAMREPTEGMRRAAASAAWHSGSGVDPANVCRAIIDAALPQGTPNDR